MNDSIIIGFDTEYVYRPDSQSNHILSYQYAGMTAQGMWTGIVYTQGAEKKHRLKLRELMGIAIEAGRDQKILGRTWPSKVYAAAHFTRADLASFKDFNVLKTQFDALRGSYSTISSSYRCTYHDKNRHVHDLEIVLRDTMAITPGGSSLAAIGDLHQYEKIKLPHGAIEQMDKLLVDDPDLFKRYAIRDAEIAAKHAWAMMEFAEAQGLGNEPPLTIGSLATNHILSLWDSENIEVNAILGRETVREQKWTGRGYRTINRDVPLPQVHDHISLATESYHGGRNEAYMFGFTHDDFWFDIDLSGAYSTAMAAIRIPDYASLYEDRDPKNYTCDVLGLARVRFRFPDDTRFPCLPVRSNHGLIFPLEGVTHVASPEIELALQMDADISIEHGIIVPWANEVRPFELFSRGVRQHRKEHKKGSIYERTWKEIGNSVYGKLAQGLREKRIYDSRTNSSQILPPSKITQPYLAAYVTSIVRAVLGELIAKIPSDKVVVSATTDGFISNAPKENVDVSGTLSLFFADLAERMTGSRDFLEMKHIVPQVLCFKTRGQLTVGLLVNEHLTLTPYWRLKLIHLIQC
jgi:hypothetical protein